MTMDCATARAELWPPERPRLATKGTDEARAHVRACDACRSYLSQDEALLRIYEEAREVRAPVAVREKVFEAIAHARSGGAGRHRPADSGRESPSRGRGESLRAAVWPVSLTGAVAVVATIVLLGRGVDAPAPTAEAPDVFVEDYLRRAVGQDRIQTSDPKEITRFLERELGLRIEPIRFAGLSPTSAEICLLDGRRGAMIVYETDGAEVAHYLVPSERATMRAPALSSPVRGQVGGDMPVVTWASPRLEQALVGEVDSDLLLELARFSETR